MYDQKIWYQLRPRSHPFKDVSNYLNDIQLFIAYFHKYDWLCHLATFLYHNYYKGGQVTKPIILVKICHKLLYVIQVVWNVFNRWLLGLSWYQTFWSHIRRYCRAASYWPRTFFTPKVFLFSISLLFVNKYHYFIEGN